MHQRWISLALFPLLLSCVTAFYPYHEKDSGSDPKDKRFIAMPTQREQSDGSGVYTMDVKRISKRNNAFPVVFSTPPSQPNAMAINQDGSDYSYFSTVKFGSKGQEMYMLIDTGSANTWVMGADCTSNSCKIHNTFGAPDSTTLNTTKQTWSLSYGTGQVQGVIASDTVTFANFSVKLGFGMATTASDDFNNYPMDGILGLGPAASDELSTPTVMQVLDKQAGLAQNIIGVHLQRAVDQTNDGQITFGGIDKTKFVGKLSYNQIVKSGSWEIAVDDASVNGTPCKLSGKSAIIDTGTSYILMPQVDAQIVHALIPGSSQNGEQFTVPCDTTAQVAFSFSGVSYNILPKDFVGKASGSACASNIIGHQAFGPNEWILGDVFLKNVYTVFDFDKTRIGFGTKFGIADTSSSSTASNTTSVGAASTGSTQPSSSSVGALATMTTSITSKSVTSSSHGATATSTSTSTSSTGDSSPFGSSSGSSGSGSGSGGSGSNSSGTSSAPRAYAGSIPLCLMMLAILSIWFS